jgi:hypothetical protein
MYERFTCRPKHDADLAGQPASIYAVDDTHYMLRFDDGSRLEIPIKELVRMKWDIGYDTKVEPGGKDSKC